MILVNEECSDQCPYFEAEVQLTDDQPAGFEEWVKDITICRYRILLPDGTRTHAKLFMDLQQRFNNLEFTNYLVNRYNEINEV